jgi:hypothetical protein
MDEYITHNLAYNTIISCQHKQGIPLDWIPHHFRKFQNSIPLSTRLSGMAWLRAAQERNKDTEYDDIAS